MNPALASLIEALTPGVLIIGAGLAVLPWTNARDERARAVVVAVTVVLMWRYVIWRWTSTLPPLGLTLDFVVGLIFVVIETAALTGSTIGLVFMSRLRSRSADVERNKTWLAELPKPPLVDVFICTYNEEAAILERTIVGALAMDHANKRVWVLDDGRRAWLRQLSGRLGANYLTRPDNAHAKAGNINNAILHVAGLENPPDFISVLDADFEPMPNFLARALTLFRDGDVGVVQTPQHFINPDPMQTNLGAARVWPDEQRYFFDIVMAAKDAWGAAFCCGTSSVIRFAPLWKIGGFPTSSVTEDYLLTLRLRAEGFRTVYLNERLSLGLAPEGLKEYVIQRSRWALGFVQICRGPLGPLRFGNGLQPIDRISLIDALLYWSASYAFRLFGIVIPILYWLLNVRSVQADVMTTLSYYLPYFTAQVLAIGWMTGGRLVPLLSDVAQLLAASQILKAVVIGFAKPKGHKFQVTAKGGDRSQRFVQWPMLNPFMIYLALTIAGVIWAFMVQDGTKLRDDSALCLFWSWYNIVILTIACVVCIEQPRLRASERLASGERAEVRVGDAVFVFPVLDVSLGGLRLAGVAPASVGCDVTVRLGELTLEAQVARQGSGEFGLHLEGSEAARTDMIRHIYSGRYSADVGKIRPVRIAAAIIGRIAK
jgi:cellulose synthase/poly-beta-1,6-N-acetylglucosamine synthase-like glycosyltransferase